MRRVELPTVLAVRFVRASAWNALWDRLIAATVVMALRGTFCTYLRVLALERLMPNLLAIVALHRSVSVFKGAGHAGFSRIRNILVQDIVTYRIHLSQASGPCLSRVGHSPQVPPPHFLSRAQCPCHHLAGTACPMIMTNGT
ncbi:unnamed protein product [Aspergillus niger]|nr:unnamed protein product [Aspergillus niger]